MVGAVYGFALMLLKVINEFRKSADELTQTLLALEEFARWCAASLSASELDCVHGAVERFSEHLRGENSNGLG
jgi:hypothetical protein